MREILELAATKHADWDAAWALLTEALTRAVDEDAAAVEQAAPALLKSLKKWPHEVQRAPEAWLRGAARYGALLRFAQHVTLYPAPQQEPWTADALAAVFASDLSRVRRLALERLPLDLKLWTRLCENTTLGAVKALHVSRCGLRAEWMGQLVSAPALWTSLTALTLHEPSLNASGAAQLASCPHLANLKTLTLPECRIGPAGRAALGASPHLSDKIKTRLRLPMSARNVAAEAAPPAPRESFGELRSLLAAPPGERAWDLICELFDRLEHSPERERVEDEALPYAMAALERWPAALRVAPQPWLQAAMDGRAAPLGLALARTVHLVGDLARVEQMRALAACQQLKQLEALDLSEINVSSKALKLLLDGLPALRSLELGAQEADTLRGALLATRPALRLNALGTHNTNLLAADVAPALRDAALADVRALRLRGHDRHLGAWRGLLDAPWVQRLEVLELDDIASSDRWGAIAQAAALPTGLRELSLGAVHEVAVERVATWLAQCTRLESLSVLESVTPRSAEIARALPPSLSALTINYNQRFDTSIQRAWSDAPLPGLRSLTLRGERYMEASEPSTLMLAPWFEQLTALRMEEFTVSYSTLCELLGRMKQLERLSLSRVRTGAFGARIGDMPALRELHVWCADSPLSTLSALTDLPWWGKLRALTFYLGQGVPTDADEVRRNKWPRHLPSGLEALDLSHNGGIVARLLPAVLESPAAATLRSLALRGCGSEETIAALVAALPDMRRLERLDLSESALNERAVKTLLASPQLAQLSRLDMRGAFIGVRARALLQSAPNIMLSAKANMFSTAEQR